MTGASLDCRGRGVPSQAASRENISAAGEPKANPPSGALVESQVLVRQGFTAKLVPFRPSREKHLCARANKCQLRKSLGGKDLGQKGTKALYIY